MPITTRKSTYTIFMLGGVVKDMDTAAFEEALQLKQFIPIDSTPDELSFGWTSTNDINDTTFATESVARGEFYLFAMRTDKRSIPGATVTNETNKAIKKELARTGKEFLSRDKKREIKEQTLLRLRSRTVPTPKIVQCVYEPAKGILYAGTASKNEIELIEDLIAETFGEQAVMLFPCDRAEQLLGADTTAKLNTLQSDYGNADYKLMTDFLTWLWSKSETINGGVMRLKSGEYEITIDGDVIVDQFDGREIVSTFRARTKDANYDFHDVKYGMWQNPRGVRAMNIYMAHGDDEYVITMNATKPATIVVKTPPLKLNGESVTSESPFLEKMYFIHSTNEFISNLFDLFLKARLSPDRWKRENEVVRGWLEASAPECERVALAHEDVSE